MPSSSSFASRYKQLAYISCYWACFYTMQITCCGHIFQKLDKTLISKEFGCKIFF